MRRLIERGLMYGNLVEVSSPTQVARYNAALEKLTGRRTALESFHIDLSGFSPEIGEELRDENYINPNGCNRQFILLTLAQAACPLMGAKFSTSRAILKQFIEDNRDVLFALTARDAVMGELVNSVYRIESVDDLLAIRTIRVEANTPRGLVSDAEDLLLGISRFLESDNAWWDEDTLDEMVSLAERVGDVSRHPLSPTEVTYRKGNFFTSHLGGLYVFRDVRQPALVYCDPGFDPATADMTAISIQDAGAVADFLRANRLVETVFDARGLDERGLLRQRLDFILVDHLASSGETGDLEKLTRDDLRSAVHRHLDALPEEFHQIAATLRAIDQGSARPPLKPEEPSYFYHLRSASHADRDLVNHLLAHVTPLDVRQLFICNKDRFYLHYREWGDAKRTYVTEFLVKEYAIDKRGVRDALFGPEPGMDAVEQSDETRLEDLEIAIEREGGSVPSSGALPESPDKPVAIPMPNPRPQSGSKPRPRPNVNAGPWGPRTRGRH
ncbi:DUF6638 family protein [Denitrobaculum tricleocarpae]|uniref:Uncharacterized protein n=1 Tax=Denitrobaculum tricleocarpae TaxID=2591009 RepID=A0A545U146_9PROT|nr:DUF6638 family protein [Denitrobaculum tricleocarpae]TQV83185.1 hypothetical protein FKG95_00870 [Denitrobaculum tricleocarpae]